MKNRLPRIFSIIDTNIEPSNTFIINLKLLPRLQQQLMYGIDFSLILIEVLPNMSLRHNQNMALGHRIIVVKRHGQMVLE